jgi:hypothetical protein
MADNPLFGAFFSPSPTGRQQYKNPMWSPADPSTAPPPSGRFRQEGGPLDSAGGGERSWNHYSGSDQSQPSFVAAVGQAQQPLASPSRPSSVGAVQRQHRPTTEQDLFADILAATMRREIDPAESVRGYAAVCRRRAAELRTEATSHLRRAPRQLALSEAAAELEAEAATWQLLWHLHGVPARDFPAGTGGSFVEGAGFAKTFRQRAADLVFRDDDINRAARAVAWLEALAAEALDSEPPAPFSAGDGVWKETRARVAAGGAGRALGGRDSGEGVVCVPKFHVPSLFSPLPP